MSTGGTTQLHCRTEQKALAEEDMPVTSVNIWRGPGARIVWIHFWAAGFDSHEKSWVAEPRPVSRTALVTSTI
eukprot:5773278-Pyramimonas_sp.AAC.1